MNRAFRRFWNWLKRKLGFTTSTRNTAPIVPRSREWSAYSPSLPRPVSTNRPVSKPSEVTRRSTTYGQPTTTDSGPDFTTGLVLGHIFSDNTPSPTPPPAYTTVRPADPEPAFRTGGGVVDSGFRTGGSDMDRDWTPVSKPEPSYTKTESYSAPEEKSYSSSSSSYSSSDSSSSSSSSSSDSGSSSSSSSGE